MDQRNPRSGGIHVKNRDATARHHRKPTWFVFFFHKTRLAQIQPTRPHRTGDLFWSNPNNSSSFKPESRTSPMIPELCTTEAQMDQRNPRSGGIHVENRDATTRHRRKPAWFVFFTKQGPHKSNQSAQITPETSRSHTTTGNRFSETRQASSGSD